MYHAAVEWVAATTTHHLILPQVTGPGDVVERVAGEAITVTCWSSSALSAELSFAAPARSTHRSLIPAVIATPCNAVHAQWSMSALWFS